jgi:hypothetical protein
MHSKFPFTAVQILWTLTFAAQLVLLVVIMGRDRLSRYPLFTSSIALFAIRLLVEMLLTGRMTTFVLQTVLIVLADVAAILSLLVVVEITRHAFSRVPRLVLVNGSIASFVIAGVVMTFWGPWPMQQLLSLDSPLALLRLMQFSAQKIEMLADILALELGLLIVFFGRRYKAPWRSHTQAIAIGLSVVSISWLSIQGIWLNIAKNAHPTTREQYQQFIDLSARLVNINKIVYIAVLIWWIAWLWIDEPWAKTAQETPVLEQASEQEQKPDHPEENL